jgi:CheY-like chemotaxis protein
MVYGFVKQSGGHLKIYSEVGHGTSVRLYFPRAVAQGPSLSDARGTQPAAMPAGSESVLVVEDDASVRKMVVNTLEGLGYTVLQAHDGTSALEILRDPVQIDLLFTDMIMPNGISGHDLVQLARELRPGIRVLLTSGYSEQFVKTADDALDVRLLSKPYRREKLATTVRAVLDGGA